MPDTNALSIIIGAVDKTKAAFDSAQKNVSTLTDKVEKMRPTFKKMAVAGTAAFTAISAAVVSSINSYQESEKQLARVDTIIDNLGEETLRKFSNGVYDSEKAMAAAKREVRDFGTQLQKMGGIADEAGAEGLAKLMQITKDSEKAMNAARLAADLAIYKQIDYASAVDIVGKVISGNTGILARYGIQLKEGATAEEAMAELAKRTAGQYEAYGNTMSGQMAILKERIGDLKESIGQTFIPILTDLLNKISPVIEKTISWAEANPELVRNLAMAGLAISGIIAVLGTIGLALPAVIKGVGAFGAVLTFLSGPVGWVIAAITALIGWIVMLTTHWEQLKSNTIALWEEIVLAIKRHTENIQNILSSIGNIFSNVKNVLSEIGYFIKGFVLMIAEVLKPIWQPLQENTTLAFTWLLQEFAVLEENVLLFWNLLTGKLKMIWNILYDNFKMVWSAISDYFVSVWENIKNAFGNAIDWIMNKLQPLFNAYERLKSISASLGAGIREQVGAIIEIGKGGLKGTRQAGGYIPQTGAYFLHQGEYVLPKNKTGGVVINITGNTFMSDKEAAVKIGNMIAEELKMQFNI